MSQRLPLIVLAVCLTAYGSARSADRPNIVLMMADDMGFSDIGCYGGEIETPHLDALAKDGLRFTQFYNGARCCPTRASLLTGLYAHQAGMGGMEPDWGVPGYRGNINKQCVTLAEALRLAGYRTYMSGKWHLTNRRKARTDADRFNWPVQRGFDRFYGTIAGAGSFFTPATLTRDNTDISDEPKKTEGYFYTDAIASATVAFLREHAKTQKDKPFFQYVSFTAPHWPLHARKKTIDKYRGKYRSGWDAVRKARLARLREMGLIDSKWPMSERPGWIPDFTDLAKLKLPGVFAETPGMTSAKILEMMDLKMAIYASMIDEMDQAIGRIVAALKETGAFENTLILFLADNGGCAEYGLVGFGKGEGNSLENIGGPKSFSSYGGGWANASNTPFRYFKHDTHEGGIASPLIVHWPARIRSSGIRRQVSHIIDVMPTFLEVARARYPKEHAGEKVKPLEGVSLVPAFEGQPLMRANSLFWEHHGNRAVRSGDWKLVARGERNAWELYDLSVDRAETKNLAAEHPDRVQSLGAEWRAWARRADVLPMNPNHKKPAKSKR